tara:strand:+ start:2986 stop:3276 length:291 start_codon:yes stop_codon:yes gene_type:complete
LFNPTVESSIGGGNGSIGGKNGGGSVESSIGGSGRGGGVKNGNGGGNGYIRGGAEEKNGNVSISRSKKEGKSTGKMKLELCYAENNPQCAICKDYI